MKFARNMNDSNFVLSSCAMSQHLAYFDFKTGHSRATLADAPACLNLYCPEIGWMNFRFACFAVFENPFSRTVF